MQPLLKTNSRMGGVQGKLRGGAIQGITDPKWPGGPENELDVVLRGYDQNPGEASYIKTKYACFGTGTTTTTNICRDKGYSPCHPDEMVWDQSTDPRDGGCGDRELGYKKSECRQDLVHYNAQKCARIRAENPDICPKLGSVSASSAVSTHPNELGPRYGNTIRCVYDIDKLAGDCEAATQWTAARRKDLTDAKQQIDGKDPGSWFHHDLMTRMCSQRAKDGKGCPKTSSLHVGADGKTICSNLNACRLCKDWVTKTGQGRAQVDDLIDRYCGSQPFDLKHYDDPVLSDPACKCRYINDKPGMSDRSAPPACFYKPCQDKNFDNYLVPTGHWDVDVSKCPDFCAEIIDVSDAGSVDIHDIDMSLSCGTQSHWWDKLTPKQKAAIEITGSVIAVGAGGYLLWRAMRH